jgi:hypothetical protein
MVLQPKPVWIAPQTLCRSSMLGFFQLECVFRVRVKGRRLQELPASAKTRSNFTFTERKFFSTPRGRIAPTSGPS